MALIVWLTLLLLAWVFVWQGFMIWPLIRELLVEMRAWYLSRWSR